MPQSLASRFPFAFSPSTAASASGEVMVSCRKCSLFAGGTADHLIGSRVCGMSPGSALLSWRDLGSTPDRRSPVSCFSFCDRVSVADRRPFRGSPIFARPLLIAAHRGLRGVAENLAGSRKTIARKPPGGLAIRVGSSGALGHLSAFSAFSGNCCDCFIFPSVGKITMVGQRFNGVKTAFRLDEDPFNGTTGNVG
jgi:hypothetical protein